MAATAWGEILLSYGTPGTNDEMATSLSSLGYIKEDSLSIDTEEGEMLQLFGTGHVLVDEQGSEPIVRIKATLIGVNNTFWDMASSPDTAVESFVDSANYSIKMASKVVGSETLEAPKCKVAAKPLFSEKEGWTVELTITVLKGKAGYYWNFGTVTAA